MGGKGVKHGAGKSRPVPPSAQPCRAAGATPTAASHGVLQRVYLDLSGAAVDRPSLSPFSPVRGGRSPGQGMFLLPAPLPAPFPPSTLPYLLYSSDLAGCIAISPLDARGSLCRTALGHVPPDTHVPCLISALQLLITGPPGGDVGMKSASEWKEEGNALYKVGAAALQTCRTDHHVAL